MDLLASRAGSFGAIYGKSKTLPPFPAALFCTFQENSLFTCDFEMVGNLWPLIGPLVISEAADWSVGNPRPLIGPCRSRGLHSLVSPTGIMGQRIYSFTLLHLPNFSSLLSVFCP